MAVKESKTSLYNGIALGFPAPGTLPEPGLAPATLPVSLVVRGVRDRHGAPVTMKCRIAPVGSSARPNSSFSDPKPRPLTPLTMRKTVPSACWALLDFQLSQNPNPSLSIEHQVGRHHVECSSRSSTRGRCKRSVQLACD
jgi:hypothetical protein